MHSFIYFEIQAENPERAMQFYRETFGWTFTEVPGLPVPYWSIETPGGPGGLLQRPAKTPPPECGTNAFVCSFQAGDFDRTADTILRLGGQTALPKFAVPGKCWQGYFLDTEGNTFGVYQPDPNAA
ncbi:MAG: VOC family protein [Verrucomicrobia bacterium]|nr:VOC family protein [Verrucomicrobiota bacterium]MCH8514178.1 VOC family protein [Kiritimatiellia bacterium]